MRSTLRSANAFVRSDSPKIAVESAPLCRWVNAGTILDVMPLDERILGFSNRWYHAAMEAATTHRLFQYLKA